MLNAHDAKLLRQVFHLYLLFALLALPNMTQAQGDGPRVMTPAPAGLQPLSLTWMGMDSNFNFTGDILIPDGGLTADLYALNYNRFFDVKGRLAELWVTGIGGSLDGFLVGENGVRFDAAGSGFSDPYVALRIGLLGAPALTPIDFATYRHGFALYALAGVTLPIGEYRQSAPLNLGTNRWSFRLGLPMTMPFGDSGRTWLEFHPSVYLYGDNDEPFRADEREQDALLVTETHLSHNLTQKLWASLDLRYQYGGETTTDGVADDNKMNQWGGGASLGYAFSKVLSGFLGYGEVFAERDGSAGEMWRARMIYVF